MNEDVLIAIYAIIQKSLRGGGLLGEYAQPLKKPNMCEEDVTTVEVYRWLSNRLKNVSEKALNERKERFNTVVHELTHEYFLNNFLLAIFLFENEVTTKGSTPERILLLPKINRLIKVVRRGVIDEAEKNGDNGIEISRDSKIAASNIARKFRGEPELTKAMRDWKINKWRKAAYAQSNH